MTTTNGSRSKQEDYSSTGVKFSFLFTLSIAYHALANRNGCSTGQGDSRVLSGHVKTSV